MGDWRDKAATLAIAAAVLFSVLFFALVAYLGWAEETAKDEGRREIDG